MVIRKGQVAREMNFNPDVPADEYDLSSDRQWEFFNPCGDWSIAGQIIEKERICVIYSDRSYADEPYSWAYYQDDDGVECLFEQAGATGSEAAIRSFIAKTFGDTIDLENLPSFNRTAIVHVTGFTRKDWLLHDFSEVYVVREIEVDAETSDEAELKGSQYLVGYHDVHAIFQRWK